VQLFDVTKLLSDRTKQDRTWLEFLRTASLSMGVYHLKAGQPDQQRPHTEDEVYYVLRGRAQFRTPAQCCAVGPGSLLFVERLLEHRFEEIVEDLTVLVFFAPAEQVS
jgi:mannose-6-phosphate isomerase-like protein (cupin superfamily)